MKTKKGIIIGCLGVLGFLGGALGQYFYPNALYPASNIPIMLTATFLAFVWYQMDTEEQNYRRNILLNIGIIGFGFIAFPYYFFHSRGFKQGAVMTLILLLLVMGWSALQYGGVLAIYYGIQS